MFVLVTSSLQLKGRQFEHVVSVGGGDARQCIQCELPGPPLTEAQISHPSEVKLASSIQSQLSF